MTNNMTNKENGPEIRGSGGTLWVVTDDDGHPVWWATALTKGYMRILDALVRLMGVKRG